MIGFQEAPTIKLGMQGVFKSKLGFEQKVPMSALPGVVDLFQLLAKGQFSHQRNANRCTTSKSALISCNIPHPAAERTRLFAAPLTRCCPIPPAPLSAEIEEYATWPRFLALDMCPPLILGVPTFPTPPRGRLVVTLLEARGLPATSASASAQPYARYRWGLIYRKKGGHSTGPVKYDIAGQNGYASWGEGDTFEGTMLLSIEMITVTICMPGVGAIGSCQACGGCLTTQRPAAPSRPPSTSPCTQQEKNKRRSLAHSAHANRPASPRHLDHRR